VAQRVGRGIALLFNGRDTRGGEGGREVVVVVVAYLI